MKEYKQKLTTDELRCLNDINVSMLKFWESLPVFDQRQMTIEYLVIFKFLQKKLAPKMILLKKETTIQFSEIEVLAWFEFINTVELVGLDPFAFAFLNNLKQNFAKIILTTPVPRYST